MNCTEFGNALNDLLMKGIASIHEKMKAIDAKEISFNHPFVFENGMKAKGLAVNNGVLEVMTRYGDFVPFSEIDVTQPQTVYEILERLHTKEYVVVRIMK